MENVFVYLFVIETPFLLKKIISIFFFLFCWHSSDLLRLLNQSTKKIGWCWLRLRLSSKISCILKAFILKNNLFKNFFFLSKIYFKEISKDVSFLIDWWILFYTKLYSFHIYVNVKAKTTSSYLLDTPF